MANTTYGFVFLVLGFATATVGLFIDSIFWWIGWWAYAISFLGVALAYFCHAPALLGKRSDGRLSFLLKSIFLPYSALLYFSAYLARSFEQQDPYHEIIPVSFSGGDSLNGKLGTRKGSDRARFST